MAERSVLPPEFADLEPFAATWSLPTAHERMQQRLHATMEAMQEFYDVVFPRAEAAKEYLAQLDLDDLPDPAVRLMWLLFALSAVSLAVELFKQPKAPDSGATYLYWAREPVP